MNKLLIIGLDGLDYHYTNYLMEKGVLPNFEKISKRGVFKCLLSTEPPNSFPAWTSFMTGVNPGEHGIFYPLIYPHLNSYKCEIVSSKSVKVKNIWQRLSNNGVSVVVINQPMTYPPFKVKGFLISGMGTPNTRSEFTYPLEIKSEILKKFPKYRINVPWDTFLPDEENLRHFIDNVKTRQKLSFYLFDKYDPEVKVVIHTEPDRISHRLWDKKQCIDYLYIEMDRLVDDYLEKYNDHEIVIVSDHGFGDCYSYVYLNNFLRNEGLLKFENIKEKKNYSQHFKQMGKRVLASLKLLKVVRKFRLSKTVRETIYRGVEQIIDFSATKVYCRNDLGLRINLQDREPAGIVKRSEVPGLYKELRNKILKIKDPYFGYPIFKDLIKKEEVYSGSYICNAPDFILKYYPFYNRCVKGEFTKGEIIQPNNSQPGKHSPHGIYFSSKVYEQIFPELKVRSVKDIAHLVENLVGHCNNKYLKRSSFSDEEASFNEEEAEMIERLRALGYVD